MSNFSNVGHETNQLLSQNVKITFDTYKTRLGSMNTLVIGGTGEGKSRYIVRPIVYSMPCDPRDFKKITDKNGKKVPPKHSFVFTDPKGELCRDTAGVLSACGYKIKIFNLVDMSYSDCYNPFKYINYNANPDQALTILIDGLVEASQGDGGSKDPHWPNMAKGVLNSLAFYLFKEQKFEYQNFTQMSKLLPLFRLDEETNEAPIDKILNKCQNESLYTHPALEWRRKITAKGGELSSIISTAQASLRLWADNSVQRLTEVDTLDLDKIGDEPTAVYIITPTTNSTYDFLVATFYNQLFETLQYKANMVYHGELPHHVLVVQDEFANTGKVPDYDKKIATFRSCNISSIIIVQSPNQIKSMYENKAQDILDNTHITIFLGNGGQSIDSNSSSAADFMSRALGKTTIKVESKSLSYQNDNGNNVVVMPNISTSVNFIQRDLMTPEEVRQLPADEEIVIIKGYKPFRDKKIDLDKCLNYGSDFFTDVKPNKQRKLKKQYEYSIEDNKKTLENYRIGKNSCADIDIIQKKQWKKNYIEKCQFSIIGKENLCYVINGSIFDYVKTINYYKNNKSRIEKAMCSLASEIWVGGIVNWDNIDNYFKINNSNFTMNRNVDSQNSNPESGGGLENTKENIENTEQDKGIENNLVVRAKTNNMLNNINTYKTALQFLIDNADKSPEKLMSLFNEIQNVNNIDNEHTNI